MWFLRFDPTLPPPTFLAWSAVDGLVENDEGFIMNEDWDDFEIELQLLIEKAQLVWDDWMRSAVSVSIIDETFIVGIQCNMYIDVDRTETKTMIWWWLLLYE